MTQEVTHSKTEGRTPPQDIVAEKSLLGAIMLADDVITEVLPIIKPRDFYDKRHETIFETMLSLYDQHKPIDLLTLTSELKANKKLKEIGGAPYLTELSNFVPAASHAKAYAEIVEKA
ncbi:replicative DNA helicase, partial [Candidatus Saccharibacteria bacterium]|nr:replicative DNA helicase [Candidatus Saccharibacteria bacterium]